MIHLEKLLPHGEGVGVPTSLLPPIVIEDDLSGPISCKIESTLTNSISASLIISETLFETSVYPKVCVVVLILSARFGGPKKVAATSEYKTGFMGLPIE